MNVPLVAIKIVQRIRKVGLRSTLREGLGVQGLRGLLKRGRTTDAFDLKYGTDTGDPVPLWKFRIDSANARYGAAYQTIEEQAIIDAIALLGEDPRALTFVDLGCGKGRALLVAANLGFKQVIGVEFVRELAEIARKNLERIGAASAVVVETDASRYRFPDADMVVYLFNPFSHEVMQKVIDHMRQERFTKKTYVIYAAPKCAALFDASGFERLGCPAGRPDIQIFTTATNLAGHLSTAFASTMAASKPLVGEVSPALGIFRIQMIPAMAHHGREHALVAGLREESI